MININNVTYDVLTTAECSVIIDGVKFILFELEVANAMDLRELFY